MRPMWQRVGFSPPQNKAAGVSRIPKCQFRDTPLEKLRLDV